MLEIIICWVYMLWEPFFSLPGIVRRLFSSADLRQQLPHHSAKTSDASSSIIITTTFCRIFRLLLSTHSAGLSVVPFGCIEAGDPPIGPSAHVGGVEDKTFPALKGTKGTKEAMVSTSQ